MPACLRAVPLDPDERRIFVNDGDTLVLQDLGDEYYSVTRTEDGYLVVTGSNGVLYYADESGEPSVFKAKSEKDRTGLERSFLGALDREKLSKPIAANLWKSFPIPMATCGLMRRVPRRCFRNRTIPLANCVSR